MTVHEPVPTSVSVAPDTVHTPAGPAVYDTAKPDDTVPVSVSVPVVSSCVPGLANVIVWFALPIVSALVLSALPANPPAPEYTAV